MCYPLVTTSRFHEPSPSYCMVAKYSSSSESSSTPGWDNSSLEMVSFNRLLDGFVSKDRWHGSRFRKDFLGIATKSYVLGCASLIRTGMRLHEYFGVWYRIFMMYIKIYHSYHSNWNIWLYLICDSMFLIYHLIMCHMYIYIIIYIRIYRLFVKKKKTTNTNNNNNNNNSNYIYYYYYFYFY